MRGRSPSASADYYCKNVYKKSHRLLEVIRSENMEEMIERLPLAYRLLVLDILREAREELAKEEVEFPASIYKLLGREEIVYN